MTHRSTIFITVVDGAIARNILQTDFLSCLIERAHVILLASEDKEQLYRNQFGNKGVTVIGVSQIPESFFSKVLSFLAQNAFRSDTLALMQKRAYIEGKSRIHPYVKRIIAYTLGYSWYRALHRRLEKLLPPAPEVAALFDAYRPNAVFATVLIDNGLDVPILREAIRRGIPHAAMVRSWDNLTTYGFVRLVPSKFFAQNEFIREMAETRHDIPVSAITVVGLPHYDGHIRPALRDTRENFCKRVNLDPQKKIILYGAVGDFIFPQEETLLPDFESIGNELDAQFIFRAHPAHSSKAEGKNTAHVIFDRGATYLTKNYGSWEMTPEQQRHLINSLYHADVIVTASGTSMLIDGATFDKPLISIAYNPKPELYWYSIARFLDSATHSKELASSGGVRIVYSKAELHDAIAAYLSNPNLLKEGRQKIRERFAEPFDGRAGERLADRVCDLFK